MKAPLNFIKDRAVSTHLVMTEIADTWIAPGFILPAAFGTLITNLSAQEEALSAKEAQLRQAAGEWDSALEIWHECSVCVLQVARGSFRGTDKAGAWRSVRANGGSRERSTQQGNNIAAAWIAADETWVPKTGLNLAAFQTLQTTAVSKQDAHTASKRNVELVRSGLWDQADEVHDLTVRWCAMARGAFPADTIEGELIRTIPSSYVPDRSPGQLRFKLHSVIGPGEVRLAWSAKRATTFNLYAKVPGASEFVKVLDQVTQNSWTGEGLASGTWAFKGEGTNATGTGESSTVVIIPVAAAAAA